MKPLCILAALLTLSACTAGPRCDTRLTPINTSMVRASAGAASGIPGRRAARHAGRGGRT
jgi:hypothetical protein